ncbi:MAG: hypothetical protein M0Q13_13000 [Methanothrix sp.]|jgi:hypothetical protein|nr:hypothetical protein [Methanothrix sp.]
MGISSIIPAVFFIAGIGAILVSGGATMYMIVGDALVALAGLSLVKLSG